MLDNLLRRDSDLRLPLIVRLASLFAVTSLLWIFVFQLSDSLFGPGYDTVKRAVSGAVTTLLVFVIVALSRRFLDHRPWRGLRLNSLRTGWRPLLTGIACWTLPAGITFVVFAVFGWSEIGLHGSFGETLGAVASLLVLVFLSEALPEELVFRGYFYKTLAASYSQWTAILVQALLFTLFGFIIGAAVSLDRIALFFVFAVVLGVFRAVSGSVWAPIGFHLAFQTVVQLFGPYHDEFTAVPIETLLAVAFGWVPFVVGWLATIALYKSEPSWRTGEPDP